MEQQINEYVNTLKYFIVNIGTWCPKYEGIIKFMNVFEKLDIAKIIARYNTIMCKNGDLLLNMDEKLIGHTDFNIFPGINLSKCWKDLNSEQKTILWEQMQHMYVCSSYIMENSTGVSLSDIDKQCVENISNSLQKKYSSRFAKETNNNDDDFNPYVGVGSDDGFSVNTLTSGPLTLPGEENKGTNSGFASFLNMKNMFNVDELVNQLKNISKKDIDEATATLKNMLGDDLDENTTNVIGDVLTNIQMGLQSDELKEGNPIENIMNMAQNISKNMAPNIKKNNIDVSKLMTATKKLTTEFKDKDGKKLFEKNSPFVMMQDMIETQMKKNDEMKNNPNYQQGNPSENLNKDMQQLFSSMGLGDMNNKDMANMNMEELMKKMMKK